MTALKQPGRRYGPAPKPAPKHRQSPTQMTGAQRYDLYTDGGRRSLTVPQLRQMAHTAARDVERPLPKLDGKGVDTPKQRKVRR